MTEKTAKRLVRLHAALSKTLESSKASIDYDEIVRECYEPDELKLLAGHSDEDPMKMLINLLEGMLESVNDNIMTEFDDIVKAYDLNNSLLALEFQIDEMKQEEIVDKETESRKRKITQHAAEMASTFPEGKTPEDLALYHSYQMKLQMKNDLLAEIAKVEAEYNTLRNEIGGEIQKNDQTIQEMKDIEEGMAKTADICTFGNS